MDVATAIEIGAAAIAVAAGLRALALRSSAHSATLLICGGTGVGKSTLLNALGRSKVAAVGTGAPLTEKLQRFSFPEVGLVIYDSKGLEVAEASQIYLQLLADILHLRYSSRPTEQIDFVLICIQEPQGRIDDAHREIASLCDDLRVPFGIAVTKAMGGSALEEKIIAEFPKASFVQPVRALAFHLRNGQIVDSQGVDTLLANLRNFARWSEPEARARARYADKTSRLSLLARRLAASKELSNALPMRATSAGGDAAWIAFAAEAATLLSISPGDWNKQMKSMREELKKQLVPNVVERYIFKRFDSNKIDSANARRIVPKLLHRFTAGSTSLQAGDASATVREAIASFEHDRPYRARFFG